VEYFLVGVFYLCDFCGYCPGPLGICDYPPQVSGSCARQCGSGLSAAHRMEELRPQSAPAIPPASTAMAVIQVHRMVHRTSYSQAHGSRGA